MNEISLTQMKNMRKRFDATKILTILSFVAFSVVLVLPFLISNVHSGHDIEYHMSMIRSFNDAWKSGNFLSRINNLACQDYGYGNSLFYSVIPSAIAVIFMRAFGLPMTGAIGLEMIALFSLNGIVFYAFLRRLFKKNCIAWVCALLYQFTPYILNQFYIRFAFSEIFLSLAIPLIFWGLCELFIKNNTSLFLLLFTAGYSLAILCHLTMAVYVTIFVLIFLGFHLKAIFKEGKIVPLAISAALILMISACYYLPMLVNFGVSNSGSLSYTSAFLSFNGLWSFVLPWLLFSSVISLIAIVSMGKRLRFYRGENDLNSKCLFVLLNVSFIMSTCIFPWFLLPNFVGMIQYVWRLFAVNSVFIYLAVAYLISKHGFKNWAVRIGIIVLISTCSFALNAVSACRNDGFWFSNNSVKMTTYENTISNQSDNFGIGSHKKLNYTPKNCTQKYIFTRANEKMIVDSNVAVSEFANYFGLSQISFIVKNSRASFVTINLPFELMTDAKIYQMSTDVSSKPLDVGFENADGKIKINLADFAGESKITIAYGETFKNYLVENPFEFIFESGTGRATNFVKKNASTYSVDFETGGATIELPTLYYKGYTLTYTTASGETKKLNPTCNKNGFIQVEVKESGKLSVKFAPKYVQVANIVSIVGSVLFVLAVPTCFGVQVLRRKKNKAAIK